MVPILGCLFLLTPSSTWAQPAPTPDDEGVEETNSVDAERAEAKRLFGIGSRLYDEGQYGPAIEAFQRAYELTEHPDLLFNMANAQERHGDLSAAIQSLDRYRVHAEPAEQDVLRRRILSLEARVKAAENAAAEQAAQATLVAPPPAEPARSRPRWGMVAAGSVTFAAFGATSAVTYGASRRFRQTGDRESYETVRPVNNVSLAIAGVGLLTSAVGFGWRTRVTPRGNASVHVGPGTLFATF